MNGDISQEDYDRSNNESMPHGRRTREDREEVRRERDQHLFERIEAMRLEGSTGQGSKIIPDTQSSLLPNKWSHSPIK